MYIASEATTLLDALSTGTFTANIPSERQLGDLLVLHVFGGNFPVSTPAGWSVAQTSVLSSGWLKHYYKIAAGDEDTVDFTSNGDWIASTAVVHRFVEDLGAPIAAGGSFSSGVSPRTATSNGSINVLDATKVYPLHLWSHLYASNLVGLNDDHACAFNTGEMRLQNKCGSRSVAGGYQLHLAVGEHTLEDTDDMLVPFQATWTWTDVGNNNSATVQAGQFVLVSENTIADGGLQLVPRRVRVGELPYQIHTRML